MANKSGAKPAAGGAKGLTYDQEMGQVDEWLLELEQEVINATLQSTPAFEARPAGDRASMTAEEIIASLMNPRPGDMEDEDAVAVVTLRPETFDLEDFESRLGAIMQQVEAMQVTGAKPTPAMEQRLQRISRLSMIGSESGSQYAFTMSAEAPKAGGVPAAKPAASKRQSVLVKVDQSKPAAKPSFTAATNNTSATTSAMLSPPGKAPARPKRTSGAVIPASRTVSMEAAPPSAKEEAARIRTANAEALLRSPTLTKRPVVSVGLPPPMPATDGSTPQAATPTPAAATAPAQATAPTKPPTAAAPVPANKPRVTTGVPAATKPSASSSDGPATKEKPTVTTSTATGNGATSPNAAPPASPAASSPAGGNAAKLAPGLVDASTKANNNHLLKVTGGEHARKDSIGSTISDNESIASENTKKKSAAKKPAAPIAPSFFSSSIAKPSAIAASKNFTVTTTAAPAKKPPAKTKRRGTDASEDSNAPTVRGGAGAAAAEPLEGSLAAGSSLPTDAPSYQASLLAGKSSVPQTSLMDALSDDENMDRPSEPFISDDEVDAPEPLSDDEDPADAITRRYVRPGSRFRDTVVEAPPALDALDDEGVEGIFALMPVEDTTPDSPPNVDCVLVTATDKRQAHRVGWLYLEGKQEKSRRKRYFVLHRTTLYYFKDEHSLDVLGTIEVNEQPIGERSQGRKQIYKHRTRYFVNAHTFSFFIGKADDPHNLDAPEWEKRRWLAADDERTMRDWIDVIIRRGHAVSWPEYVKGLHQHQALMAVVRGGKTAPSPTPSSGARLELPHSESGTPGVPDSGRSSGISAEETSRGRSAAVSSDKSHLSKEDQEADEMVDWINSLIGPRGFRIYDLNGDFRDGRALINLLEVLTNRSVAGYDADPQVGAHKINNLKLGLARMKDDGIDVGTIEPKDFFVGSPKVVQLLKVVREHYKDPPIALPGVPEDELPRLQMLAKLVIPWANGVLSQRFVAITKVDQDLKNGTMLMTLLELLTSVPAGSDFNWQPMTRNQRLDGLRYIDRKLTAMGVAPPTDFCTGVVEGDCKTSILALGAIMQHFRTT